MSKQKKPFKFDSEQGYLDEMKKLSRLALAAEEPEQKELEKEYEKIADELMRFTNKDE